MLFLIASKVLCNIIFTMIDHVHCPYWSWLKKKSEKEKSENSISVILLHGCFTAHYRRIQTIDNLITKDIKTSSSRRALACAQLKYNGITYFFRSILIFMHLSFHEKIKLNFLSFAKVRKLKKLHIKM